MGTLYVIWTLYESPHQDKILKGVCELYACKNRIASFVCVHLCRWVQVGAGTAALADRRLFGRGSVHRLIDSYHHHLCQVIHSPQMHPHTRCMLHNVTQNAIKQQKIADVWSNWTDRHPENLNLAVAPQQPVKGSCVDLMDFYDFVFLLLLLHHSSCVRHPLSAGLVISEAAVECFYIQAAPECGHSAFLSTFGSSVDRWRRFLQRR